MLIIVTLEVAGNKVTYLREIVLRCDHTEQGIKKVIRTEILCRVKTSPLTL